MKDSNLVRFLKTAYANEPWPRPFHILEGLQKINRGMTLKDAAKVVKTTTRQLENAQKSKSPEYDLLGVRPEELTEEDLKGAATILGGLVLGLEAEDCFPLATYKILSALDKQNNEHLPYVFTIVGVPNLTALSIRDYFAE